MIRVENVSKTYTGKQGTVEAVKDVSLEISRGEIFGVIGFSGAGKSTLIRLLNGLETVTSGQIYINEKDITTLKRKELLKERQKIAMIFQHFNLLWSRTVEENIAFSLEIAGVPKAKRKAKVAELIDLVGLTGREKSYPSQLSGGQKQRVGIARALANDPEVLLCDEATSALDPETTAEVLNLIKDIRNKLPEELKVAKFVRQERERILAEAKKEANDIVKEAENRIIAMIDEHEITKKAYEQKNQIMSAANDSSRQITSGAKEYADNILATLQKSLEKTLKEIEQDRKQLK